MNTQDGTSIASRFYGLGGPCRTHYVRGCSRCLLGRPAEKPALEVQIGAILDLLPLEDAWDDLRADLVRAKITPGIGSPQRRRLVAQLVEFHVARSLSGEGGRVKVHQIAEDVVRG